MKIEVVEYLKCHIKLCCMIFVTHRVNCICVKNILFFLISWWNNLCRSVKFQWKNIPTNYGWPQNKTKYMFSLPYMNEFVLVCFKIKFLKDWLWRPPVLLVGWYWHCETNFSPTSSKINELLFGAKCLEIKCQIWICMCIV